MEQFNIFIRKHFFISLGFFMVGILFGIIYSINLLGYSLSSNIILPTNFRSLHITYMLYGFVPLMLSILPFFLIIKDGKYNLKGIEYLEKYFFVWYVFLILAFFSLLFGVTRGLAFYDFHYYLNFILAFSGLFYILALYHFIKEYDQKPLWIKVSLTIVIIAPLLLLVLMNPTIGKVEATVTGPHGDNTLGMSFALLPIYYLIIKYLSTNEFKARWHILWQIPLFFYIVSVLYRSFIGHLTYNQEWFFQYLTLLYIPLLYRWYKDANIDAKAKIYLLISIVSFVLIDIEGNILFIPSIRWPFHRNDLVVAHAHIAMGISILFMVFAIYTNFIKQLQNPLFYKLFLTSLSVLVIALSVNGFVENGYISFNTTTLWTLRTIFGTFAFLTLFLLLDIKIKSKLDFYNIIGFMGDGLAMIILIMFGDAIYKYMGFYFDGVNSYIVFSFVLTTGLIHLIAYLSSEHKMILTSVTALIRIIVGSMFIALFLSKHLGDLGIFIGSYDLAFALIYLLMFHKTTQRSLV